jgi:hypothetical protein
LQKRSRIADKLGPPVFQDLQRGGPSLTAAGALPLCDASPRSAGRSSSRFLSNVTAASAWFERFGMCEGADACAGGHATASQCVDDASMVSYLITGFIFNLSAKTEGMAEGLAAIPEDAGDPASVSCLVRLAAGMHSFCKTETEFAVSAAGITAASGDDDDKPVSDLITGFCCLLMVKETGA